MCLALSQDLRDKEKKHTRKDHPKKLTVWWRNLHFQQAPKLFSVALVPLMPFIRIGYKTIPLDQGRALCVSNTPDKPHLVLLVLCLNFQFSHPPPYLFYKEALISHSEITELPSKSTDIQDMFIPSLGAGYNTPSINRKQK